MLPSKTGVIFDWSEQAVRHFFTLHQMALLFIFFDPLTKMQGMPKVRTWYSVRTIERGPQMGPKSVLKNPWPDQRGVLTIPRAIITNIIF